MIRVRAMCLLAALGVAAGCAKEAKVGQLCGAVTFKGKPVPAGYISFMPVATAGNSGQVKVAQIRDGLYDTAMETNPGIFPGGTIIRIAGFDGKKQKGFSQGKQIFNPYELRATVPEGTATMDFTVPPSAAERLRIEPTSDEP